MDRETVIQRVRLATRGPGGSVDRKASEDFATAVLSDVAEQADISLPELIVGLERKKIELDNGVTTPPMPELS